MTKLLQVVPKYSDQALEKETQDVLEMAIKEKFESVIILGFKTDQMRVITSRMNDTVKLLGAIEMAKDEILRDSRED